MAPFKSVSPETTGESEVKKNNKKNRISFIDSGFFKPGQWKFASLMPRIIPLPLSVHLMPSLLSALGI
jgi:hypothetical protein